ncbi:metal-dependent hydrolase [Candidatus Dependentiae bacterium]|nr:metal-dependent hydrolase [Candidatus Dependentiae bacterium]
MPNFKGHVIGGLCAYAFVAVMLSAQHTSLVGHTIGLSATLAGALFPDIDTQSKGQRLYLKVLALILLMSLCLRAYIPLLFVLALFFSSFIMPHRGIFHDLWFISCVLVGIDICLLIAMPHRKVEILMASFFFLAGVLSHLLLDKGFRKTFR